LVLAEQLVAGPEMVVHTTVVPAGRHQSPSVEVLSSLQMVEVAQVVGLTFKIKVQVERVALEGQVQTAVRADKMTLHKMVALREPQETMVRVQLSYRVRQRITAVVVAAAVASL
jgi:hypothetical protein